MNKKLKKAIIILAIVIAILALMFFIRFILGGPEDTWICSAGEWIKHGNPIASMPNKTCA